MKAFVRIDNRFLSQLIFGNDEIEITAVAMYETGPNGYVTFHVQGNPDIIGVENCDLVVKFKTETRVISREIGIAP